MKISNIGLSAFYQTAHTLNMTRAAQNLGITQSALSQRVKLLEEDLQTTLFIREGRKIQLTEAGSRLLIYCKQQSGFENELLSEMLGQGGELSGHLRVAGFSSVLRSVVIPSMAEFLRQNPNVKPDFRSFEVIDLENVLLQARADMIFLDYVWQNPQVESQIVGHEEYVVIESSKYKCPSHVYLDHGPHDNATLAFFEAQDKKPRVFKRSFMGDVYGIIDGVREGLGRAVMSQHLIRDMKGIKEVSGYKKYERPITLNYFKNDFYPRLMNQAREALLQNCQKYLGN